MVDIRKVIIIFVIGILFSVLVFALIEAVYPRPEYSDYCRKDMNPRPIGDRAECETLEVPEVDLNLCSEEGGYIDYHYDSFGCPTEYYCETCSKELEDAQDKYFRVVFFVSAILSLVAIFIGVYLPAKANTLNEWIGTGFMLGGTFALFFGTMQSYGHLDRILRPIIIFLELALVIFISYKKIGNFRPETIKKK